MFTVFGVRASKHNRRSEMAGRFTAEASIRISAPPLRSLRLCGEASFPTIQIAKRSQSLSSARQAQYISSDRL